MSLALRHAAHYFSELLVVARVGGHIMAGLLESLAKSMGTFCDRHSQKLCIAIDIHNNCALQWLQIAKSQTCLWRRVVLLSATFHMEAHSSHEIVQSVHPVARQVVPVNYRFHAPVAFWYLSQSLGPAFLAAAPRFPKMHHLIAAARRVCWGCGGGAGNCTNSRTLPIYQHFPTHFSRPPRDLTHTLHAKLHRQSIAKLQNLRKGSHKF